MKNILETHTVPEDADGIWIERYAADAFSCIASKKGARKALKRGEILIDGEIGSGNIRVRPGQRLELLESSVNPPKSFPLVLNILYEDSFLAIVEKPAGIPVNGNRFRTVENALSYSLVPSDSHDALKWPRPVHRLDNSTGGLLVAAKTGSALVNLSRQFEERVVEKRYRAIVKGLVEQEGSINEALDGRDAFTRFVPVESVRSLRNDWLSLLDLFPRTGRTHQLRRHCVSLGFPIIGDRLYGSEGDILKGKGLFLQAVELSLVHPETGERLSVSMEQAPKFNSLLLREQRRWEKFR
ncbi:MAG: RluA family pseudouridine synthase [bacterium]|nr:RluA family pseudouridine synthase [bacterium]